MSAENESLRERIDEAIFARDRIIALKTLRAIEPESGVGESLLAIYRRYRELRTASPERFAAKDDAYWADSLDFDRQSWSELRNHTL